RCTRDRRSVRRSRWHGVLAERAPPLSKGNAVNPYGTHKWTFNTGCYIDSAPAVARDGTIYIGSYDNNLYALNPNGTQKWKFTTGSFVQSSPAIGADGTIYFGSVDGHLYALGVGE